MEEQNLEFAKTLWRVLMGIAVPMEERLVHLYRILGLSELLRRAPVMDADPKGRVADVLCSGSTDMATLIGASSRLRYRCAKCVAGGIPQDYSKNSTLLERKLGFRVGAFDGPTSRLCEDMAKELGKTPEAKVRRPFQACAEHAVYEKMDRLPGTRPSFTYAVQKKGPKKEQPTFEVKVVKRCENCEVAGGSARDDGTPFGFTPRLGRVVTDHPSLIGLDVPVVTARVLQYLRNALYTHYGFNPTATSGYVPPELRDFEIPQLRVWADVTMQQHAIVSALGPTDSISINKELSDAGLHEGLLDPGHDEL